MTPDLTITEMSADERSLLFPIILSEYNPAWPEWFIEEKANLEKFIGNAIFRFAHIGSTSVPGLLAKPTVDILIEIATDTDIEELKARLPYPEYIQMPDSDKADVPPLHLMFVKGYTNNGFAEKVFHIHVRYIGDWDEMYFCEYLAANPEVAGEYAVLKRKLKAQFEYGRDSYTAAKGEYIIAVTKQARIIVEKRGKYAF